MGQLDSKYWTDELDDLAVGVCERAICILSDKDINIALSPLLVKQLIDYRNEGIRNAIRNMNNVKLGLGVLEIKQGRREILELKQDYDLGKLDKTEFDKCLEQNLKRNRLVEIAISKQVKREKSKQNAAIKKDKDRLKFIKKEKCKLPLI